MIGAAGHAGQQTHLTHLTHYRKSKSNANVAAGYHRVVLYKVMRLTIKAGRLTPNEKMARAVIVFRPSGGLFGDQKKLFRFLFCRSTVPLRGGWHGGEMLRCYQRGES